MRKLGIYMSFMTGFFIFAAIPELVWAWENKPITGNAWHYHLAVAIMLIYFLYEMFMEHYVDLANNLEVKQPPKESQHGGSFPIEECDDQLPDEKEIDNSLEVFNERKQE